MLWTLDYQLCACTACMADAVLDAMQTVLTSPELKSITENTGVSPHWSHVYLDHREHYSAGGGVCLYINCILPPSQADT